MDENTLKSISNALKKISYKTRREKIRAILVYHGVSDQEQKNCVPVLEFENHLKYLLDTFSVISLDTFIDALNNKADSDDNYVVLTFDDGYRNFYKHAYPLLVKYNLPAGLFVPSKLLNKYNSWDFGVTPGYSKLEIMNEKELNELDPSLIEIGAHSATHPIMSELNDEDLAIEIRNSKKHLTEILKREVKHFAYPYGGLNHFDVRAKILVKNAGYRSASSTHFGRFNSLTDLYSMKRISIWDNDTVIDLKNKLNGYYDWLAFKEKLIFNIKSFSIR